MSKLLEKLAKSSTIKESATLSKSEYFGQKSFVKTPMPVLNAALSSDIERGLTSGVTVFAGPSKHFKTQLGLICVAAYMKKHDDAVCIYYDNEFGSPPAYIEQHGIDPERVLHCPITTLEQLRTDVANQMNNIERGDRVIIFTDSFGNLASAKEVKDALEGSDKADMTRAKVIKSIFRIITPHINMKDIPYVAISHSYKTMEMYSKDIISGGTGIQYSADTSFILGRRQIKEGKDVIGYQFVINVEKSRFVREGTQLVFDATYDEGVDVWSGLLDLAVKFGHVEKPKMGWFSRPTVADDKNWRRKETSCEEFWEPILDDTDFAHVLHESLMIGSDRKMVTFDENSAAQESAERMKQLKNDDNQKDDD